MKPERKHPKIKPVHLPPQLADCGDMTAYLAQCIREEIDVVNVCLHGGDMADEDFSRLSFEAVRFDHCRFVDTSFARCSFDQVQFDHCVFENCNFSDGWFRRCAMVSTQCRASRFNDSRLTDVTLQDCSFRYANFSAAHLDRCGLRQTDFSDAFFASCVMKHVYPSGSKFSGTEFFQTPLRDVDFSNSELEGICVSTERSDLAGVIVNREQAADLAKLMGIVIRDSSDSIEI